jgi:hypothetical protein
MPWLVTWTWDSDAETPEEAAREALDTQRDADSIATVFTVTSGGVTYEVDLTEGTSRFCTEVEGQAAMPGEVGKIPEAVVHNIH